MSATMIALHTVTHLRRRDFLLPPCVAYFAVVFEHVVLRADFPVVDQKLVFHLTAAPLYTSSAFNSC